MNKGLIELLRNIELRINEIEEDNKILKKIEERDKKDTGYRYTLEEALKILDQSEK